MADVLLVRHRRPRQFRRNDLYETNLPDDEVRRRYRFSTDNIDRLVQLVEPTLQRLTRRNRAMTVRQQLLMTLRFLASGAFLQVNGDTFGVDVATVSRVVTQVTDCLFRLKDLVIRFPMSDADRRRVMTGFNSIRGSSVIPWNEEDAEYNSATADDIFDICGKGRPPPVPTWCSFLDDTSSLHFFF